MSGKYWSENEEDFSYANVIPKPLLKEDVVTIDTWEIPEWQTKENKQTITQICDVQKVESMIELLKQKINERIKIHEQNHRRASTAQLSRESAQLIHEDQMILGEIDECFIGPQKNIKKVQIELEYDGECLGPLWLNRDNLELLLYSGTSTNRELLKINSYEEVEE